MSFQRLTLIGNLGADPELTTGRSRESDRANFSVAANESWKDRDSGQKVTHTEWFRCVAWGHTANFIADYCKKGNQVYLEGRLRTSKYTDKEGIERYSTSVTVDKIFKTGLRKDSEDTSERTSSRPTTGRGSRKSASQEDFSDVDDDIPF